MKNGRFFIIAAIAVVSSGCDVMGSGFKSAKQLSFSISGSSSTPPLQAPIPIKSPIPSDPTGTQAAMSDSLVDSIGVNAHMDIPSYQNAYSSIIKPSLKLLGIRHLRVSEREAADPQIPLLQDLHSSLGIDFNLQCDPQNGPGSYAVQYAKTIGISAISSVEGINEPDGYFESQHGSAWAADTVSFQQDLYTSFKTDPSVSQLPIYGTSVIQMNDISAVQSAFNSEDYNNIHPYPSNRNPETTGWGDVFNGYAYGSLLWGLANYSAFEAPSKPTVATETGYFTLPGGSNAGIADNGIDELYDGKYIPRIFFYNFIMGIARTFTYEFFDENVSATDAQQHYGLIRNDGSPKPAFTAVQNMIGTLTDPGPVFTPGKLNFVLSGQTANVETALLQKRNGTFYLALWLGLQGYDPNNYVDTPVPAQAVTLQFARTFSSVSEICPGQSSSLTPHYNEWRIPIVQRG